MAFCAKDYYDILWPVYQFPTSIYINQFNLKKCFIIVHQIWINFSGPATEIQKVLLRFLSCLLDAACLFPCGSRSTNPSVSSHCNQRHIKAQMASQTWNQFKLPTDLHRRLCSPKDIQVGKQLWLIKLIHILSQMTHNTLGLKTLFKSQHYQKCLEMINNSHLCPCHLFFAFQLADRFRSKGHLAVPVAHRQQPWPTTALERSPPSSTWNEGLVFSVARWTNKEPRQMESNHIKTSQNPKDLEEFGELIFCIPLLFSFILTIQWSVVDVENPWYPI